jgi:hypothetical protein
MNPWLHAEKKGQKCSVSNIMILKEYINFIQQIIIMNFHIKSAYDSFSFKLI